MGAALAALILVMALVPVRPAAAAEWGDIRPGISTTANVRELYGAPTKTSKDKVDNYDTETWIYDEPKAPAGLKRLTVEYGLMVAEKYQPSVVRALRVEPQPGGFTRRIIILGWGTPDRTGRDGNTDVFVYYEGLIVYFDDTGQDAKLVLFTVPQPRDPADVPAPRR
jgi:hypothetical protein